MDSKLRLPALDADLLLVANRLPHSPTSDRVLSLVSDLGRGVGWAALCAAPAVAGGRRGRVVALRSIVLMLVANYLAQGPLKRHFGRRRPFHDHDDHIVVGTRTLDLSFPSGHTATSFAAATSLAIAYPKYSGWLLLAASTVGFSRVYLGHHYPSDVLGGIGVGLAVGTCGVVVG